MINYKKREILIKEMRGRRMKLREIAKIFHISSERVRQIASDVIRVSKVKNPLEHKTLTSAKLSAMGFDTNGENPFRNGVRGGKDYIREWIRIRDNHTCQICLKKWEYGRRFDVHHLDEEMEGKSSERGASKWDREHMERMITLCHRCHLNLDSVKIKMDLARKPSVHKVA